MSARPLADKKRARTARAFRQKLPAYFDVWDWLIRNGYARTRRQAKKLIKDERLRYEGSPIGMTTTLQMAPNGEIVSKEVPERYLSVEFRRGLSVDVAA